MTVGDNKSSDASRNNQQKINNTTKSPAAKTITPTTNSNSKSSDGKSKHCHQCQHFKADSIPVWCTNQTGDKCCRCMYCHKCLMNRYGEKAEEVTRSGKWTCPKCRGVCNCSICRKRRGQSPTGILIHKAKASGFSCVSEMLVNNKSLAPDVVVSPAKVPKSPQVPKAPQVPKSPRVSKSPQVRKPKCSIPDQSEQKALTSVAGIFMAPEQVGNALQFLEFCAVFGKILDFKKGEPEYVLQDLLDGESGGKFSATVQFHIYLLRMIQKEHGEELAGSLSNAKLKSSWFDMLKILISGSQTVLKGQGFDCFNNKTDYGTLNPSEKLMLLNMLCHEVLETKKVKNWVGAQSRKIAAEDKDKSLKRARGHEIDSVVNHGYQSTNTVRTDPVFKEPGYVFWKLTALGEADILCQDVGKGSMLSLDEKWSSVTAAGKEAIEKRIFLSREHKKPKSRVSPV